MESYPSHGSLGRFRTTQTAVLPSSHACLATLSTRAKRLCERTRWGGELVEENGGNVRLVEVVVGVEHRLIKEEVVACARHAKSKSPK